MATPPDAKFWRQPIDPTDKTNFVAQFRDPENPILEPDEIIEEVEITLLPEAIALGLTVIEGDGHGPFIADDTNVEIWFEVEPAFRSNAAYSGNGVGLPVQITVVTDSTPFRRYQRTLVLQALQL